MNIEDAYARAKAEPGYDAGMWAVGLLCAHEPALASARFRHNLVALITYLLPDWQSEQIARSLTVLQSPAAFGLREVFDVFLDKLLEEQMEEGRINVGDDALDQIIHLSPALLAVLEGGLETGRGEDDPMRPKMIALLCGQGMLDHHETKLAIH